jgi:stage V sporulation protein G
MPSKKRKDGQFKDIAHPLNQETRAEIENAVFDAYENEVRSMGENLTDMRRETSSPSSSNNDDY